MKRRTGLPAALVLLAFLVPVTAAAQDRIDLKVGGGPILSTYLQMETGAHLFAALEAFPFEALGLRVDGSLGAAAYAYRGWLPGEDQQQTAPREIDLGLEPLWAVNLGLVARWPKGWLRPYVIGGMGYNDYAPWSREHPIDHNFGFMYGAGLSGELGASSWFLEFTGRVFGNVLNYRSTDTKSFAPVTIGARF
jgi:hypothetical protein